MPNVTYKVMLNNKPKRSGLYALLLRLTMNRERKSVNLGYDIPAKAWNPKKEEVRSSYDLADRINRQARNLIKKGEAWTLDKSLKGEPYTLEQLQQYLAGKEAVPVQNFTQWAYSMLDVYYPLPAKVTRRKQVLATIHALEEFSPRPISFAELTIKWVKEFEIWLRQKRKIATNTVASHLSRLRRLINIAIAHDLVAVGKNPFRQIPIKGERTSRPRLSLEEIKLLEAVKLVGRAHDVRNTFLLQFYLAGARVAEVLLARHQDIQGGRWVYVMPKTDRMRSILVSPKAQAIIDYYTTGQTMPESYLLPFLDSNKDYSHPEYRHAQISAKTAILNKYLKIIGPMAGIDKPITTHMARHSFADLARRGKADLYAISKALGHATLKQTETYMDEFDQNAADEALNAIRS